MQIKVVSRRLDLFWIYYTFIIFNLIANYYKTIFMLSSTNEVHNQYLDTTLS